MADYRDILDHTEHWEGGISVATTDSASSHPDNQDGPRDSRGRLIHTNKGIQWRVYKALAPRVGLPATHEGFLALRKGNPTGTGSWEKIYKVGYWDAVQGDLIHSQSIANLLAEWAWGSGSGTPARAVQQTLNRLFPNAALTVDGAIGPRTVAALNHYTATKTSEKQVFDALFASWEAFLRGIAQRDPVTGAPNLQGWLNRIYAFYEREKKARPSRWWPPATWRCPLHLLCRPKMNPTAPLPKPAPPKRIVLEFDQATDTLRYDLNIEGCLGVTVQNQGPSDATLAGKINIPAGDQFTLTVPNDNTVFGGSLSLTAAAQTTFGIIYFRAK